MAVLKECHIVVAKPFGGCLPFSFQLIHGASASALIGYGNLQFLHLQQCWVKMRVERMYFRMGKPDFLEFEGRVIDEQQRVSSDVQLAGNSADRFALRLPRNLRTQEVLVQVKFLENL